MKKVKVTRIIVNGVSHRLVNIDDSMLKNISEMCSCCSLQKECFNQEDEDTDEHVPRYLCDINGGYHPNTLFVIDTENLDKTIRELLNDVIEV